ncbi:hypothetical protein V4483_06675 [Bacillus paranthracis]|uniref:hypothetical protein n=1 Tax=Bacillus paranthracis TaxID=2026186 RepID=UPI002FCD9E32
MEVQTEQKKIKKEKTKKNKRLILNEGKINLVLYTVGGGIVGSALFAATTLGGQGITNAVTLIAGLGGGVISGLLTLEGVRKTIKLQKEKELEDSKPQKILSIHIMNKLTTKYETRINMLWVASNAISKFGDTERLDEIVDYYNKQGVTADRFQDKMIEESLKVSEDIYFSIKDNLEKISFSDVMLNSSIHTGKIQSAADLKEDIAEQTEKILAEIGHINIALRRGLTKYEQSMFSQKSKIIKKDD